MPPECDNILRCALGPKRKPQAETKGLQGVLPATYKHYLTVFGVKKKISALSGPDPSIVPPDSKVGRHVSEVTAD